MNTNESANRKGVVRTSLAWGSGTVPPLIAAAAALADFNLRAKIAGPPPRRLLPRRPPPPPPPPCLAGCAHLSRPDLADRAEWAQGGPVWAGWPAHFCRGCRWLGGLANGSETEIGIGAETGTGTRS